MLVDGVYDVSEHLISTVVIQGGAVAEGSETPTGEVAKGRS